MRTQPGTKQRPKAFHRVYMNFMKTISIFITGILTRRKIDALMPVAPLLQTIINVVFISINQGVGSNSFCDDGLYGNLLNIGQHLDANRTITLEKT